MEQSRKPLRFAANVYVATIYQVAVALLMLMLTRIVFVVCNPESTDVDGLSELALLCLRGLRFDLVAVAYFNALFILLRILPWRWSTSRLSLRISDWVYYVTNTIMLAVSLGDVVYYRFSGTRMRWSGLREVAADTNIGGIVGQYLLSYWWMGLAAVAFIALMVWLYRRVDIRRLDIHGVRAGVVRVAMFLLLGGLTFLAMRGRAGSGNPLGIADATWEARTARQVNVVLNTPFTLLRSIGKGVGIERLTFFSEAELSSMRSSVHPAAAGPFTRKNVMIIIMESGGAPFIDTLDLFDDGSGRLDYLMPFVDSIATRSLIVDHYMATGRSSNGGANAILASFPAFEPFSFMLSPYNATPFDSPASLLKEEGYATAFYYGCNHGSFQIDQLSHASGYDRVVDRANYEGDPADYDGTWGIYDTPMGQFVARDLSALKQPWIASWFTISAHSPHKMPTTESLDGYRYRDASPERGLEYTDRSLRRFFEAASRQPWFANTIFVITADHGNRDLPAGSHYDTPYIRYHLPLIIYAPDGSIEPRRIGGRTAAQFDLAPTLLSLLGYPKEYVAVGRDILDDSTDGYGLSFIDNRFMISSPRRVVFTDARASAIEEVYDVEADPELRTPLAADAYGPEPQTMLRWTQAFMQDFTGRINDGRLTGR